MILKFAQQTLRSSLLIAFCLLSYPLHSQEGDFSVRIKQPVVDTLRTCPGKSIIFQAEGFNSDGTSFDPNQALFTWNFGYQGTRRTGSTVSFVFPDGGHYVVQLIVTGSQGQSAENTPAIEVFVAMPPNFTGTRSDQTSICSGNELNLTGFVLTNPWTGDTTPFENSFASADFVWSGAGIQSNRSGIARIRPPLDLGHQSYVFTVKDDFGCFHDTTLLLYGLFARYDMEPKKGEAPLEVTFSTDSVSNGGLESSIAYAWEFYEVTDTLTRLTTTLDVFSFERPGQYMTRMTASYQQCRYSMMHDELIKVDSSLLEIPNIFTPNEDGANDYFQVKSLSLMSFEGQIFNRWGNLVYEWTDWKAMESGWNGRYQNSGKEAPPGTYYYVIKAVGYDDVEYRGGVYKGFLTLIR